MNYFFVMPGLVLGIHVLTEQREKDVDGRDKAGHDAFSIGCIASTQVGPLSRKYGSTGP
jgi:hypothetical protein